MPRRPFGSLRINCFRPASSLAEDATPGRPGSTPSDDAPPSPPRLLSHSRQRTDSGEFAVARARFTRRSIPLLRYASGDWSERSSTKSSSVRSIPPLSPRVSDPKIEAMMMPEPADAVPSKCLRLSHPRMYADIIMDMKSSKGCRDWRSFEVFPTDDVDMTKSADDYARRKAKDYAKRVRELEAFGTDVLLELAV